VGATGSAASRISVVPAQRIRFGKGGRNTAMHSLSGELFHLLTPALKFWHTRCCPAGDQQTTAFRKQRIEEEKCPASDIPECREHTCVEVVQQMTVEGPQARVVSVEGYHHSPTRWHEYGVAHRAWEALAVDLDDLELMAGVHATLLIDQMYFAISPVRFTV